MVQLAPATQRPNAVYAQLVDEELFRLLLDLEVQKAQRLRYVVSVVYIDVESHVRALETANVLAGRLRATDAVTIAGDSAVALLLVDADASNLLGIVRRLQSTWLHSVAWSAGAACYPETATSADELIAQASDMMIRARGDGGRRLYPDEES
jgi:GGDEF domain-containing protein